MLLSAQHNKKERCTRGFDSRGKMQKEGFNFELLRREVDK
jgi:hypothetical protein